MLSILQWVSLNYFCTLEISNGIGKMCIFIFEWLGRTIKAKHWHGYRTENLETRNFLNQYANCERLTVRNFPCPHTHINRLSGCSYDFVVPQTDSQADPHSLFSSNPPTDFQAVDNSNSTALGGGGHNHRLKHFSQQTTQTSPTIDKGPRLLSGETTSSQTVWSHKHIGYKLVFWLPKGYFKRGLSSDILSLYKNYHVGHTFTMSIPRLSPVRKQQQEKPSSKIQFKILQQLPDTNL